MKCHPVIQLLHVPVYFRYDNQVRHIRVEKNAEGLFYLADTKFFSSLPVSILAGSRLVACHIDPPPKKLVHQTEDTYQPPPPSPQPPPQKKLIKQNGHKQKTFWFHNTVGFPQFPLP